MKIRLCRPERRNAVGLDMVKRLNEALSRAAADEAVNAIVIAGTGSGFCAGSDLKELGGLSPAEMGRHERGAARLCRTLLGVPKPTISAVEGFAIGGGFILAAAADVVVSSRAARWHLPEVSLGWLPPWGLHVLVRRVGLARAQALAWGADPIDGAEAYRQGLVDWVTDSGAAEQRALEVAGRLAALPREVVAATKLFFERLSPLGDLRALDESAAVIFECHCHSDVAKASFVRLAAKGGKLP